MSQFSAEAEAELQSLLRQLLKSIKDRISGAPSIECAEEILLHLEETDKNFHNYEFVKYLRQYVESSLGAVIEEETESCARGEGYAVGSVQDTLVHAVTRKTRESGEYKQMMQTLKNTMMVVVESLINKFEEDQLRKEEMHRESQHQQSNSHYTDNCSDSDSSFNQSYAFIKQEQLQVLAEKLDPGRPKEVRWEALQALCCAPPSDVLSCESWSGLRRNLSAALADPDPDLSDKVLRFFAKTFSCSPLNVTREIYTSLAKSLESDFLYHKLSLPTGSAGIDVNRQDITRLLKQMRLMNDFQKEVTTFWIRHPEKYMEEIIESTFSLLSINPEHGLETQGSEKALKPMHLIALLDIKATWFKKWMHGYYSRTVVFRLLERKYKSLIVAALQQCIHYHDSCDPVRDETAEVIHSMEHQHIGTAQRTLYTTKELEYMYFVHSLCVLGRLLMYTNGRKLFPVTVWNRKDPVSLTDLLVILISIMYQHPKPPHSDSSHADTLSPTTLVMELLRTLSDRTECAVECLYQTPVIETLLAPIITLLKGKQAKLNSPETTLIHIADTLARIATTERGLSLFLDERNIVSGEGEGISAAHVIVQFTQRLLAKELPLLRNAETSYGVSGAFIFVCRQMYNTCEGLQVLRPYGLHECIAAAWKKTTSLSERVPTPVPGAIPGTSSQELQNVVVWEETLLDNLLNFAATPKGLLLLQQTGAINECVTYMFSRFTKKLQVSRCEKFGYGVMVTQVAATAPGVVALHSSGFVQALVVEIWSVLECGREDVRVVHPKSTPMDPIDRSCLKSFLSLVNLLSSPHAVWELLGQQPLPNKAEYNLREMPTSITDLIDRLIAVNSDVKIHSLFNYEQSHTFGLRLLSVMCCNLDSLLLLESQYNISDMLLQCQKDNITDPSSGEGDFIIDGLSVERNHILVRMSVIGGPSERRLPLRVLQKGTDPYPWPMFSSYPLPKYYILNLPKTTRCKQDCEISAFLSSTKNTERDGSWMDTCRRQYCKVMTTKSNIVSGNILADLLEKAVSYLSALPSERFFPPADYIGQCGIVTSGSGIKTGSLSSVDQLGIRASLRYGRHLNLLRDNSEQDLCLLMKHCQELLSQQRAKLTSELYTLQGAYPGHDWFASTVFLIMAGDMERALRLLLHLSTLLTSAFLWPARLHGSVHLPMEIAQSSIHPVYSCTAHYVEMLLKTEVPLVFSAFRMSGFTPSQMCVQWLGQCFWNYLDWSEICHYVSTCVVMGPDYQVYMCVALLKHLQQDILQHTQTQDLQVFLKEEPIQGFRVSNYLEYMEGLERSYRTMVLTDMNNISQRVS
ncbi:protein broad-minded isoform X1 [Oncorhynchus tshawytscha]|uniref:protein broad-minded isoform X1 n=1 Tax=Oncorhynchus tshawytscha TaxID=74940 RepID=UPI000D09F407|nr:protein broad-minded isoform X1 [Oncorhynchus tshawytscha]XP_024233760.1 protein broad-minded isoform X1 [Oncorhynchus tshawytscha]